MRILSLLIVLVIIHTAAMAEDAPDLDHTPRNGRLAILFLFDGLNLGSFGGGIGGKYWLSELWAMNASVRLQHDRRHVNESGGGSRDFVVTRTGFATAFERHLLTTRFSPYVGAGVAYNYEHSKNSNATNFSSDEIRGSSHEASVALGLGVEFWLSRNFSLAGQYSIRFRYSDRKDRRNWTAGTHEASTDYWVASVDGGLLILAVCF